MIVCGTAGTGKSYLINAIVQCLTNKVIITGTTGMAAFHISGETLYSVLQLIYPLDQQSCFTNAVADQIPK